MKSETPSEPRQFQGDGDWKQTALLAIASDELGRAELARVKRELEEARAELAFLKDKHNL